MLVTEHFCLPSPTQYIDIVATLKLSPGLNAQLIDEEVRRIVVVWALEAQLIEVLDRLGEFAHVGDSPISEQEQVVEEVKDITRRLVNGTDDGPSGLGHLLNLLHQLLRHEGIQAGGWLVTEHDRRIGENLGQIKKNEYSFE